MVTLKLHLKPGGTLGGRNPVKKGIWLDSLTGIFSGEGKLNHDKWAKESFVSGKEDEEDRVLSGVEEEGDNEKAPSTWYMEVTFSSSYLLQKR